MPAISNMLSKLNELHKKSNNPENKCIYSQLITAFSPAADTVLSFEQIVSGIILIAQHRDNIQESAAVSFFYKKTSRKAVLDSFISAIMQEYAQQPEFVTKMNTKISELKEPTHQVIQNYSASLFAEVNTAKRELSDAQRSESLWLNTPFREFYAKGLNDDLIDAKCKAVGQLVLEKQAQVRIAEKRHADPHNYAAVLLKTSNYLSEKLNLEMSKTATESSSRGVELLKK